MGLTGRDAVVCGLLGVLALGGCGGGAEDPDDPASSGSEGSTVSWPAASSRLDGSGVVFATGSTVQLSDGSRVEVGQEIRTFVVAGAGVFFTASSDETQDGYGDYSGARPLYYSAGGGRAEEVAESAASLRVSPDGRYLAFLDLASGEEDDYGTPQAEAVVVDLDAGEEVVRSSDGMGDPDTDDLAHEYPETLIGVLEVADEVAYVQGVGDVIAYDLVSGEGEVSEKTGEDFRLPPFDDRRSPDGAWRIVDDDKTLDDAFASRSGDRLEPDGPGDVVDLLWWLDDRTAAGIGIDGTVTPNGYGRGTTASLVTCAVPAGRCEPVEGTEGATLLLPEGVLDDNSELTLPG